MDLIWSIIPGSSTGGFPITCGISLGGGPCLGIKIIGIWKRLTNGYRTVSGIRTDKFFLQPRQWECYQQKMKLCCPWFMIMGLVFYLKIINSMMILPPIIIKVVALKFFTESIRFETFVVISIVGLDSDVWVVVVVVRRLSIPGSAV